MKLHETETTVTTIDLSARTERNIHGGSPLRLLAVVATTERGTYAAGRADHSTLTAHRDALALLGAGDKYTSEITRGFRTNVELAPKEV